MAHSITNLSNLNQDKKRTNNHEKFINYFVEEFETKLLVYHLILEGKIENPGKYSNTLSGIRGQRTRAAAGESVGLSLGMPGEGAKLGAAGGKAVAEKVGRAKGNEYQRKTAIKLKVLVDRSQNNKAQFRQELVKDGSDIFQSYEMQFMKVTTDQGPEKAMQLLAKDATNRSISYYAEKGYVEGKNVIESIVLGKSKIEPDSGIAIPCWKTRGYKVDTIDSPTKKWSTASLYEKVGLVREEAYYEKIDGKSRVDKYGHRRLLKSEDWNKLKDIYKPSQIESPFKTYHYIFTSQDLEHQQKNILESINFKDKDLMEERIREPIVVAVKEIEEVIKKQNHEAYLKSSENNRTEDPIRFDVKDPVDEFTGRKNELLDLHGKVHRNPEKPTEITRMTVISGLGGLGKTELARQYIQEHGEDFQNVVWINSESEATLLESFSRLVKKLNIETKDGNGKENNIKYIAEDVCRLLSKRKTLFIFDNAEKDNEFINILHTFRISLTPPSEKPYTLITSRDREWKKEIEILNLNVLTPEDAENLVKKKIYVEDESQIKALIEKLQYFPLAIKQAIAYIEDKEVNEAFSISNYLEEYEKKTRDLLDSDVFKEIDNDYEKTTFTTWKITTDKIARHEEHGKLALDILNDIAYLASDNIYREMFLGTARYDETKLKSAVRLLVKYSIVNGEGMQTVLSIHRLVQEVIRLELKGESKEENVLKEVFELVRNNFPYGSNKSEDLAKKRQQLPHLETFTSHIDQWIKRKPQSTDKIEKDYLKNLLVWMSHGYQVCGDPRKEKELLERALTMKKKHYGLQHLEAAITLASQATANGDLGDHKKQKELLEKALPILETHYGLEHFEVTGTLTNLGNAYGALSDHQKQKELLERALPILERHYGLEHFEVAGTLTNLGNAYGALSDHQKQKELLERALPILEKHYGSEHFEVARAVVNLANAYGALDDHQKQKELLERALPILEKHYGLEHFEVAGTLTNLARAYGALGDHQKEKELLERALTINKKHYGLEHFEAARTLTNLGIAYGALGDDQKKKELLERALPILEKHYGLEHFEVAITLGPLGNAYGALGDHQKKKELLERASPIVEKHYGLEHFEVARAIVDLGNANGALGDHQKKKELLERALPILEKHYGLEHFEVVVALGSLASAYGALGDQQKEKDLLKRALPILVKHVGLEHFEVR
uniref:OdiLe1 n=1 Tax=Liposcelis sp. PH-2016 TaxID=1924920 RepID=A0A3Q8QC89_9NEOP|nr:OdiLe1 [Liposcelis sp. PH-2016]